MSIKEPIQLFSNTQRVKRKKEKERDSLRYDDVIKWKHVPRYWPFVWGIHRSPVNFSHEGQWRRALIFFLIGTWTNGWGNNRDADDLRRHRAHYDVTVMKSRHVIIGCSPEYHFLAILHRQVIRWNLGVQFLNQPSQTNPMLLTVIMTWVRFFPFLDICYGNQPVNSGFPSDKSQKCGEFEATDHSQNAGICDAMISNPTKF